MLGARIAAGHATRLWIRVAPFLGRTDGRTEFTHPETAGSGGGDGGGGGVGGGELTIRKWHCHRSGCVVAVVHPLVLLFSFDFFENQMCVGGKAGRLAENGSKGFVCIHRYFQIVPGIPHGNRGQYRQQTQTDDMHAFLNAGEQHPPVSLVLLLLLSARSSHALLFAFLLSTRTVRSSRKWGPCRLVEQLVVFGH